MLYAGRNAERLFAAENNMTENGVTTGASNDIEKATGIIKKMITEYGMSKKFGLLNLEELDVKPDVITEEAVKLAEELNEESFNMMKGNADKLKKIAEKVHKSNSFLSTQDELLLAFLLEENLLKTKLSPIQYGLVAYIAKENILKINLKIRIYKQTIDKILDMRWNLNKGMGGPRRG